MFLLSVIGVFTLVVIGFYAMLATYNSSNADTLTKVLSLNHGVIPKFQEYNDIYDENDLNSVTSYSKESEYKTRYFVVQLDENMEPVGADLTHISQISAENAFEMARNVVSYGKETDYYGEYRYRVTNTDKEKNVIFLDCYENLQGQTAEVTLIAIILAIIAFVISVIFILLSNRVVKPFEKNAKLQKQFITDASHELKTPLAIISSNAEVLSYKNGENKWLDNIICQVDRMSKLINDLILLSKMEEVEEHFDTEEIDLSKVAQKTLSNFSENFESKNVRVSTDLQEIVINGNKEQVNQLCSILIENASKYTPENGEIRISLKKTGKYLVFSVFNTANIEGNVDCENLFERFYRTDSSHSSETGGQGIGLSVAKKIALLHGGNISANLENGGIKFTVKISSKSMINKK